jgi:hypothetical protein
LEASTVASSSGKELHTPVLAVGEAAPRLTPEDKHKHASKRIIVVV